MSVATRQSLANRASEITGISRNDAYLLVSATVRAMREAVLRGESIQLREFGTFRVVRRKKRYGHVPHPKHYVPGEWVEIEPHSAITFQVAKTLKPLVKKVVV